MREIKFRAWDKELKKMCNLINLDWFVNSASGESPSWIKVERNINDENGKYCRTDEKEGTQGVFELMQWTGLKDKNGKEIYEGDIVKFGKEIGSVEWFNGDCPEFFISSGPYGGKFAFYEMQGKLFCWNELEIVGNIYENPELMEAK